MQNLINELMLPTTDAEGKTIAVSTVKRRAAEAIQQLHARAEQDTQARLHAENELRAVAHQYENFRKSLEPADYHSIYAETMNGDRHADFT